MLEDGGEDGGDLVRGLIWGVNGGGVRFWDGDDRWVYCFEKCVWEGVMEKGECVWKRLGSEWGMIEWVLEWVWGVIVGGLLEGLG